MTDLLVAQPKACLDGTHRARTPEATFDWIEPMLPEVGITRVADVTWLDDLGIPVYQAIRPDSWSLCVSQGKGLTDAHAKVSAAMESIELWHGERTPAAPRTGTPRELAGELGYRVDQLNLPPRTAVHPDMRLDWSPATVVGDRGAVTWVPRALVAMDSRMGDQWCVPLFEQSTNGLASGNTLTEAVLHGLYEVVERDAMVGHPGVADPRALVALDTLTGAPADLVARMNAAGVHVAIASLPSRTGLPVFQAAIRGDSPPVTFGGSGCHLDREVALCRALTEAAQSRVTLIAGARDDIRSVRYTRAELAGRGGDADPLAAASADGRIDYGAIPTVCSQDLADDLRLAAAMVARTTGSDPVFVDHTRPELGIPVVHVLCPGLRFDPKHA
jgi:ribosomal protein S12 methylthiotransferase accessory factor